MTVSDPIADLLTRIRNALQSEHRYVDVQWSKMKECIVQILQKYGFADDFKVTEENKHKTLRIYLKYGQRRKPIIKGLKRVSKPGKRVYVPASDIPCFFGGLGIAIISSSQGVIDGQSAKEKNIGGELLCLVW